jgi:hypothetical protein
MLPLMIGVGVERLQRPLLGGLPPALAAPLRLDEDLTALAREAQAGEALLALGETPLAACRPGEMQHHPIFGSLLVAAAVDQALRTAAGDSSPPSWPDSLFMSALPPRRLPTLTR